MSEAVSITAVSWSLRISRPDRSASHAACHAGPIRFPALGQVPPKSGAVVVVVVI
jgi:hypothetical protein